METMTVDGTEKRVDELSKRVDELSNRVDDLKSEMREGFRRLDADARGLRASIGSFQRLMVGFFATTLGSIVAGVVVLVASHS
jgi:hypothetical protein